MSQALSAEGSIMGLKTRSLYPCEYGRFVSSDTLRDLDGTLYVIDMPQMD